MFVPQAEHDVTVTPLGGLFQKLLHMLASAVVTQTVVPELFVTRLHGSLNSVKS